jgi:hypothetical protein
MAITNVSKPTTSFSNSSKVSIGETWATVTTTWAAETRTWLAVSQLFTNTAKDIYGYLFSFIYPLSLPYPFASSGLSNQSKP